MGRWGDGNAQHSTTPTLQSVRRWADGDAQHPNAPTPHGGDGVMGRPTTPILQYSHRNLRLACPFRAVRPFRSIDIVSRVLTLRSVIRRAGKKVNK